MSKLKPKKEKTIFLSSFLKGNYNLKLNFTSHSSVIGSSLDPADGFLVHCSHSAISFKMKQSHTVIRLRTCFLSCLHLKRQILVKAAIDCRR